MSVNDRRKARSIKGLSLIAKDSETSTSAYETDNFIWHMLRMIHTELLETEHDDIADDYDMICLLGINSLTTFMKPQTKQ